MKKAPIRPGIVGDELLELYRYDVLDLSGRHSIESKSYPIKTRRHYFPGFVSHLRFLHLHFSFVQDLPSHFAFPVGMSTVFLEIVFGR